MYWVRDPIVGTRLLSSEERIDGTQPHERFGSSIAGVGDLDDDGFEDILVGAPGAIAHGNRTGAAYLIVGEQ